MTTLTMSAQKIATDADALAAMDIPPHSLTNVIWRTGWDFYRSRSAWSVYRARKNGALDPDCQAVFDFVVSSGRVVKPAEVIAGANVSRAVASYALNELAALGHVERVGHGRYAALVGSAI